MMKSSSGALSSHSPAVSLQWLETNPDFALKLIQFYTSESNQEIPVELHEIELALVCAVDPRDSWEIVGDAVNLAERYAEIGRIEEAKAHLAEPITPEDAARIRICIAWMARYGERFDYAEYMLEPVRGGSWVNTKEGRAKYRLYQQRLAAEYLSYAAYLEQSLRERRDGMSQADIEDAELEIRWWRRRIDKKPFAKHFPVNISLNRDDAEALARVLGDLVDDIGTAPQEFIQKCAPIRAALKEQLRTTRKAVTA